MISLSTGSLYHLPVARVLAMAAEAGFDGVELVAGPETWARGAARAATLARRQGLEVLTVHQALTPIVGGDAARRLDGAVTAALQVGCPHLVIHPPFVSSWGAPVAQRWLASLERGSRRLDGSGTRIALENSGYTPREAQERILASLPELMGFCIEHDLDVTYDVCHAAIQELDVLEAYRSLRPRMRNVHLSNLLATEPLLDLPYVRPLFTEHRLPHDGSIPLDAFLARLAADGYFGPVTSEISPVALQAWSPARLRRSLAGIVAYVRDRQMYPAPCPA